MPFSHWNGNPLTKVKKVMRLIILKLSSRNSRLTDILSLILCYGPSFRHIPENPWNIVQNWEYTAKGSTVFSFPSLLVQGTLHPTPTFHSNTYIQYLRIWVHSHSELCSLPVDSLLSGSMISCSHPLETIYTLKRLEFFS